MRRGCFVCGKSMDRIFIFSTPEGKYKLCRGCFEMVKHVAANTEVVEDEEIETEEEN